MKIAYTDVCIEVITIDIDTYRMVEFGIKFQDDTYHHQDAEELHVLLLKSSPLIDVLLLQQCQVVISL